MIFLLGHSDSGKTTFCRKLINLAVNQGKPIALVDSDVGQTTIGPPACIGSQIFMDPQDAGRFGQDFCKLYFVGSTSPRGNLLPMVSGTYALAKKSLQDADLVIMDTTGLVLGDYGLALKYHKINLIRPRYLVFFEKSGELGPYREIFFQHKDISIWSLNMGNACPKKTFAQRAKHREQRFFRYFQQGTQIAVSAQDLGSFPPLSQMRKRAKKWTLLGLGDQQGHTLGLGIFLGFTKKRAIRIHTPLPNAEKIKFIIWGNLQITSRGKQL